MELSSERGGWLLIGVLSLGLSGFGSNGGALGTKQEWKKPWQRKLDNKKTKITGIPTMSVLNV